jgi:hypothetical protein
MSENEGMKNDAVVPVGGGAPAEAQAEGESQMLLGILPEAIKGPDRVEVLRELRAMRNELVAEKAKIAFGEAMARLRAEAPIIVKSRIVPSKTGGVAYKYAAIEDIEIAIRDIAAKHGFSHSYDASVEQGWVTATCIVRHVGGHSEKSTVKLPIVSKTAMMTDAQQYAATLTFAQRRALAAAYGLVIAGEDTDGRDSAMPVGDPVEKRRAALRRIWARLKHEGEKDWANSEAQLRALGLLAENEIIAKLDVSRLEAIAEALEHDQKG